MYPTVPQRYMYDFLVAHHNCDHVDGLEAAHGGTNQEFTGFSDESTGMEIW